MAENNDDVRRYEDLIPPSENIPYVQYDTGIDFGTTYLTENVAFFLGCMFAADESVIFNGKKYQIAPFRYNYNFANRVDITRHLEKVRQIARPCGDNIQIYTAENIRGKSFDTGKNKMPGFSAFVSTKNNTLEEIISQLKIALEMSPESVKRSFFTGIFDGCGSIDRNMRNHTIRYISVDCPNNILGEFLFETLTENNIPCNYNTARDRLEGGNPRNNQLRVKSFEQFAGEIGFISPKKNNLIVESLTATGRRYNPIRADKILPGLIIFDIWE